MSKKDYPELEGKEILWTSRSGERTIKAIVAGCNYDIGLSIVAYENKERYLTCLNGPSSGTPTYQKSHKTCFYAAIAMIKKGHYKVSKDIEIDNLITGKPFNVFGAMNECSFS